MLVFVTKTVLIWLGTVYGGLESPKLRYSGKVKMWAGSNKISLLSIAVGLPVCSLSYVILSINYH